MRTIRIFLCTLILLVGSPYSAGAQNLLTNPDAEDGTMSGWTADSNIAALTNLVQGGESLGDMIPRSGSYFFSFADSSEAAAGGPPTSMFQDIAVTPGDSYNAEGFIQTCCDDDPDGTDSDAGELKVTFFDGSSGEISVVSTGEIKFSQLGGVENEYDKFVLTGTVPAGAVTARYELFGVLHQGTFINTGFDDLQFEVTPGVKSVEIDIKPGSDPNCFNINGHGVIPVAILGSSTFDVTLVDTTTLLFGGLEVRMRGKKGPLCNFEDSDGDTILDLVCHFEDDSASWAPGDGDATLIGTLLDGTAFGGTDSICVTQE